LSSSTFHQRQKPKKKLFVDSDKRLKWLQWRITFCCFNEWPRGRTTAVAQVFDFADCFSFVNVIFAFLLLQTICIACLSHFFVECKWISAENEIVLMLFFVSSIVPILQYFVLFKRPVLKLFESLIWLRLVRNFC
jgi:hypothetical protein